MTLEVLIRSITWEAPGIHCFELIPLHGQLPSFCAGAHIDVHLPGDAGEARGLTRQYSLLNPPSERHRYLIAVQRLTQGRGGSDAMHRLMVGQVVPISPPRNYFSLAEHARQTILVAGGIGITPLLSMASRLQQSGKQFQLHYCCRDRTAAAFLSRLAVWEAEGKVNVHCDGGESARGLQVASMFEVAQPDTQVYCCGPAGLMSAVREATRHWPAGSVHFESFSPAPDSYIATAAVPTVASAGAPEAVAAALEPDAEFEIEIASTNRIVAVRKGQSMLQVLRAAGIEIDSSCEAGTCGSCKTGYLSGTPEHQDFILDDDEQQRFLMPCVSRCRSARIVLDL